MSPHFEKMGHFTGFEIRYSRHGRPELAGGRARWTPCCCSGATAAPFRRLRLRRLRLRRLRLRRRVAAASSGAGGRRAGLRRSRSRLRRRPRPAAVCPSRCIPRNSRRRGRSARSSIALHAGSIQRGKYFTSGLRTACCAAQCMWLPLGLRTQAACRLTRLRSAVRRRHARHYGATCNARPERQPSVAYGPSTQCAA